MAHSAIMSVRITGNSNDAVKAFEKATKKAAAFGSFVGNVAAKGVEKLWDKLSGFTSDVVNMSDSVDKFKNTMKFAGIDSSAIDKAAKDARKYADETVYGLDDIQNTMAQLAANGVKNYTEITQAAGNLNAVAGGNADTFKSVTMALTQTIGAGKLTTENWNQIANAIPGASGKLQEAMKKNNAYTGDFRDAMAKGQITADEFSKALVDLGMTDVAKQAARSTQTIEGALGNLEAAVTGGLTDAFNLFKPAVTGALSGAASAIESFGKKATGSLEQFAKAFVSSGTLETGKVMLEDLRDAGGALAGAFGDLIDAVNPFSGEIKDAGDAGSLAAEVFNKFTEYVAAAALKVKDAAAWLKDMASGLRDSGAAKSAIDVFNKLKDVFNAVTGAIKSIIGALPGVGDGAGVGRALGGAFNGALGVIDAVAGALGKIADWATNHAELIIGALVGIGAGMGAFKAYTLINSFVQAMKGVQLATKAAELAQAAYNVVLNANPIGIVITALAALVAGLTYFFTQTETGRAAWAAFTQFLTDAWNNVCAVFQIVCDAIGSAWQAICDWVQTAWQAVVDWFTPILETLKGIFEVVCSVIQGYWDVAGEYVRAIWYTVKDAIQTVVNIIKGIFDVVCAVIRGDWQAAGDAIKGIWENIKGFFERTLERIKAMFSNICSAIQSAWQGAGDGVRRIWEGIKAFFGNLCNGVRGFFNGLGNGIRTIFTNAGNGVKSAWNGVLSWFRNLPQSIMNIFSNAGQWLWNAGSNIINGLWNGLKSAWNNVTGWVSGLGDWIASHKGPESYDRQLLVTNGRLIMQGFAKGLTLGFDKDVQRAISGVNGKLKTMPLSVTAAYEMGAGKDTRPNVTVNINGKLLDEEGTARELNRILDDYAARRR